MHAVSFQKEIDKRRIKQPTFLDHQKGTSCDYLVSTSNITISDAQFESPEREPAGGGVCGAPAHLRHLPVLQQGLPAGCAAERQYPPRPHIQTVLCVRYCSSKFLLGAFDSL